jgi:hypothetical protein
MNLGKKNKRLERYIIPLDQALMKAKIRALKMGLVKACHEEAFEEGEVDGDERAGVHGMEAVAVACLEAALAKEACAEGVVAAAAEDFADIPAADWLHEVTDVGQEEEEALQRA